MPEIRYIRFVGDYREPVWGRLDGETIIELAGAPWAERGQPTGATRPNRNLVMLAPAEPTKILALAYNYKDMFADPNAKSNAREAHFTDAGFEPLVFLKGPNCATGHGHSIVRPDASDVWVEVEVAAVIGTRCRNLEDTNAARHVVFGLTIGNDMTALNILGRDWHLARSKSLDGFCPLGPELVTGVDDSDRVLATWINGRQTQSSSTRQRVLDTYESVVLASRIMTLEAGDVVLTGTPAGARQSLVAIGDTVSMEIDGIGRLSNQIIGWPS